MIELGNLDKAEVLAALFNGSGAPGPVALTPAHLTSASQPARMTKGEAETLLDEGQRFDYVRGRVLKVDLSGDSFNPAMYDRDNGQGAAQLAVNTLNAANQ